MRFSLYTIGRARRQPSALPDEWSNRRLRRRWVCLLMSEPAIIQIIGSPVACADGVKDTWRDLAGWIGGKLRARYGTAVTTIYYDLFDPNCPLLPPDAQLPLVLVDGELVSSGGKLSMPVIRHQLDALGVQPNADRS